MEEFAEDEDNQYQFDKTNIKKGNNKVLFIDDKIESIEKFKKVEEELKKINKNIKIEAIFGVF